MKQIGTGCWSDEWHERMNKLMQRGLSLRAARTVVNAAMYGIGCIEGEVRARIEAEKSYHQS